MINSIIQGISIALNTEFGDDYNIYAEVVEQGLKEPCFFISCISPTNRVFLGKRYFIANQFCIQYFPIDRNKVNEECNEAAQRLYSCLEYITVGESLMRGIKMSCELIDGILNFFVNYDFFVYKDSNQESMEEISGNITTKGQDDE